MDEFDAGIFRKAGVLLARRPFSRSELRARLLELAEPEAVEPVLDRLQALNLLNDCDYAYNFAFRRMNEDGWGSERVRMELIRHGVSASVTEASIERAREGCDEEASLRGYLQQRLRKIALPRDAKAVQRLVHHLIRRGFSEDSIRQVLREMLPAVLFQYLPSGD